MLKRMCCVVAASVLAMNGMAMGAPLPVGTVILEDFEAPDVVGTPPGPTVAPEPYWANISVGGSFSTPKVHAADAGNATQYYDVDPVADGVQRGARQYWHFTPAGTPLAGQFEFEFDVKGVNVATGTQLGIRLREVPSGGFDELGLTFDASQVKILDQSGPNDLLVGTWLEATWQHIKMTVDTNALTVSVSLDGAPAVATTYTPGAANVDIGSVYIHRHAVGSTKGFSLDNLQVTVVPEPASLALLGIGGLLMLSRRRSQ